MADLLFQWCLEAKACTPRSRTVWLFDWASLSNVQGSSDRVRNHGNQLTESTKIFMCKMVLTLGQRQASKRQLPTYFTSLVTHWWSEKPVQEEHIYGSKGIQAWFMFCFRTQFLIVDSPIQDCWKPTLKNVKRHLSLKCLIICGLKDSPINFLNNQPILTFLLLPMLGRFLF